VESGEVVNLQPAMGNERGVQFIRSPCVKQSAG